jgi:murein DD-endopeptidase MepM/ murein hydrolase activator NlpD
MTAHHVISSLRLVAITAFCTSVFWLLVGALSWPHANGVARQAEAEAPLAAAPVALDDRSPTLDASGSRRLVIPVEGVLPQSLVDTYEDSRAEGQRQHDAIDIMAPGGTPVVAAAAGTVEKLYTSEEGGNSLYVRSPDRTVLFYYAHLRNYAPRLMEGDTVQPGDPLGTVGWTGNASRDAPHLHFAISLIPPTARWWEASTPINPYGLLLSGTY